MESLAILDNGLLLSGSNDKTIKLWRVEIPDVNSTIERFKFNLFYYFCFIIYFEILW